MSQNDHKLFSAIFRAYRLACFQWKKSYLTVIKFFRTCFSVSCQNLQCHLPEPVCKGDKKNGRVPTLTNRGKNNLGGGQMIFSARPFLKHVLHCELNWHGNFLQEKIITVKIHQIWPQWQASSFSSLFILNFDTWSQKDHKLLSSFSATYILCMAIKR